MDSIVDSDGKPCAAIFSKSDPAVTGTGSLFVEAKHKNALKSKDVLIVR